MILKYIKKIYESLNDIKVLSIDGNSITLINPDGKKVTIQFEEDDASTE